MFSSPVSMPRAVGVAVLLAIAIAWTAAAPSRALADVRLVEDGKAVGTIYLQAPYEPQEQLDRQALRRLRGEAREAYDDRLHRTMTVDDLVHHIELITGAKLPIVVIEDASEAKGPGIVIGEPAVELGATPKYETVMEESLRVMTKGDLVLIGGEGPRSYRHGVYELLRELGCDWLFPGDDGIVTPKSASLTVSEMDIAAAPAFDVRGPWYSGGPNIIEPEEYDSFERWKMRQQQTLKDEWHDHPDFMWGGHMWASLLSRYRNQLDADPTMRAQVRQPDGTLGPGRSQLDPTHPRVLEISMEYIRWTFEHRGWPNDKHVAFSVGPNDGPGYSQSPAAIAKGVGRHDPITGATDQTDVLIWYANTLQEMAEKEFPNIKLGWLIYSVHGDYPMVVKPNPKFIAHFADITQSRFHSLLDERSPTRVYYKRVVDLWADLSAEQGNPLWYYGYNWNLAENLLPYSKMKIWGQDLPYYHQKGFLGHNNESDKAWSILGPHNYLMARMGWDIDLDWRQVLDEYCAMAFGKGGPYMAQYYLALIEAQETAGSEAGAYGAMHLVLDDEFMAEADRLVKQAMDAADTERDKRMVDWFSQSLTAGKIYLAFREAVMDYDYAEAVKQFDAMVAHWDKYNEQNSELVSRYGRRYINWLFKPMAEQGLKYSSGDYEVFARIPDELPMAMDPHVAGAELGLHLPAVDHSRWMTVKTYSSSFAEQGLQFVGPCAVWYRHTFEGPQPGELADGQGLGLFVGSVEDEVRVFINGNYIGSGRGFIRPFQFDLTEHVKPGEDNVLAMQVVRNSYLNENGRGGIIYPCFLFTGPRLEQAAPNNTPLIRMLPGGATEPITR